MKNKNLAYITLLVESNNEDDFEKISEYIYLAVTDFDNKKDYIKNGVAQICAKYPLYE